MRLYATIIIAAALVLAGCASPVERVVPTGEPGVVPMGWVVYCHENPQDPSCPRREP